MAATVKIGGYPFPVESYSVQEESTPLAAGDTSGSTGLLTLTIPSPQPGMDYFQTTGMRWVHDFGRNILQDKPVQFKDPRWGAIPGVVTSVSQPSPGLISITATTDMNVLNAYNVHAQPFVGPLGDLIRYYVGLAETDAPVVVHEDLEDRPIVAQGWVGELWYYLKMLAVAEQFEIALVNGVLEFRTLRERELVRARDITRSGEISVPTLARGVEVYQYNNQEITNRLVYPPGGWTPELEVLNVNAGETATYTLELSASVSSIQTPTMLTSVDPTYGESSVYTIVANDGLPVPEALWRDRGGSLSVVINPDTTSLTVTLTGATGIPLATGGAASQFQVALASDASGSRYSTLRIVGTGVRFRKEKKTFPTGVPASRTATEVGVTVDNIFLGTKNRVYSAGVRAAVAYSGPVPSYSAEVAQAFRGGGGLTTGNVAGARITDPGSKRPFRVRTASISPSTISVQADDDLTHDDMQGFRFDMTYADVQASRDGTTYRDDYLMGLR